MSDSVYSQTVTISKKQLESFIPELNRDLDEGEKELTVSEVLSNKRLLTYICSSVIDDGTGIHDPFEFWNSDGWCEWKSFR
ncbi:MAG: hypothetical protein KAS32_06525 [Candidatus Peribacteraceae bacterium]|nr:hypothetical protein [Candidatus Peribacteraceae bacterium]